jgi:Asp-tRNA(Asn)/Glu-tRNA(Gln) amidotransferase A subunit family amidase
MIVAFVERGGMNGTTAPQEAEKIVAELPDRISDVIKPFARESPDHPALVQGNVTWSYGELAAVVADTALILKHYDIRPGDRVMIASENSLAHGELLAAVYSLDLSPDDRARIDAAAKTLSPEDQSLAAYRLRGITANHSEWIRASRVRAALRGQWFNLFQEVDIVLCPPMPSLAFPHDHTPQRSRQLDIDGSKIPYYDQMAWAGIATLNGLPATTMPNGRSESGLPIGVQIIGGYLEDRSTIAFAGLIEREFGGFTPPPI